MSLSNPTYVDYTFPYRGTDRSQGYERPPRETTYEGVNVRSFDPTTDRRRGGTRSGVSRFVTGKVNGTNHIQELAIVQDVSGAAYPGSGGVIPGGGTNANKSQMNRSVTLLAVSGGTPKVAYNGAWQAVSVDGAATLSSTVKVIRSAFNGNALFFVDANNWTYYQPSDNKIYTWTPSAGSLPVDVSSNKPRLICTWRGRTVLSGLPKDANNWFMSAVNNALDWDYAPTSESPTQAVAGNNAPAGKSPDIVTALIPYSDDVLIFGGDHSIWQMSGDPADGGRIDLVSDAIGIAWGNAWAKDGDGKLYFLSNKLGVYTMTPGGKPVRMSQQVERLLQDNNLDECIVRLLWDEGEQGLHIYVTPFDAVGAATHFFWEKRSGAWWVDRFADNNQNPLCCVAFDGNSPEDRVSVIGSWDGYVRGYDTSATDDDGSAIESSVWLGPILTRNFDDVMLKDLQAVMGAASGEVTWEIYAGQSSEDALASAPVVEGTWSAGRNLVNLVRRSGHAIYIKLSSSVPWQMEGVRASISDLGKVRRRS